MNPPMVSTQGDPTFIVKLEERDIYGIRKFYPKNRLAEQFCLIARTKTMTQNTIDVLKDMGYQVVTDRVVFSE